jgi:multidrug efflux system membrane fusion protein
MTASSAFPAFRHAGLLLLAALALAGCSRPQPAEEPLRAVKVMAVGTSTYDTEPEFSAEVRPRIESRLGFRVAGKITRRQAELGQHVKAGHVLAQLDPQDYRLAAEGARAQHAAALTNRDLAEADLKRYRGLREQNFISAAELERRESTYKAAQAQLEQAQAQMSSQGNQAQYTTLVADVPGIITAIEAEPGQVVTAGTPVVRIAQDGERDVVFSVPEDRAGLVKPGSAVAVRGWSDGKEMEGKVREVAASADAVTRTYTVKVAIDAATAPALGATVFARPGAIAQRHAGAETADERPAPGRQGQRGLGARQGEHDGALAASAGGHGGRQRGRDRQRPRTGDAGRGGGRARAVAGTKGIDLPREDGGARRGCGGPGGRERAGPGHSGFLHPLRTVR